MRFDSGSCSDSRWPYRRGIFLLRGALSFEIHDIAGEQARDVVSSLQEIAMRRYREEVSVAKDRKLSLEAEQISFGRAIELSLFRRGVAAVALRDMTGDGESGEEQCVGSSLCLAASAVPNEAKDLAAEGNSFLPDL